MFEAPVFAGTHFILGKPLESSGLAEFYSYFTIKDPGTLDQSFSSELASGLFVIR